MPRNYSSGDEGKQRKRKGLQKHKPRQSKHGKRRKLPLDGLKVPSKKICRGRLTVDNNAQGGMYLKGLRSQFTERYALNDENSARRDEDLCRLIDCGLSKLRKQPDTLFDEHKKDRDVNPQHYSLFGLPKNSSRNQKENDLFAVGNCEESCVRQEPVAKGEEIDRAWQSASHSFLLRSPEVVSPGFRLPQHHLQHSPPRIRESNEKSLRDLAYLLARPDEGRRGTLNQLPSIHAPSFIDNLRSGRDDDSFFRFGHLDESSARQQFTPTDHSTPIASERAVAHAQHEFSVEDNYLHFQERLDRVLHDFTSIIVTDDLDDRQQLCQYYMRRLRSMEDNSSNQRHHMF